MNIMMALLQTHPNFAGNNNGKYGYLTKTNRTNYGSYDYSNAQTPKGADYHLLKIIDKLIEPESPIKALF